jgi:hypothetical protein
VTARPCQPTRSRQGPSSGSRAGVDGGGRRRPSPPGVTFRPPHRCLTSEQDERAGLQESRSRQALDRRDPGAPLDRCASSALSCRPLPRTHGATRLGGQCVQNLERRPGTPRVGQGGEVGRGALGLVQLANPSLGQQPGRASGRQNVRSAAAPARGSIRRSRARRRAAPPGGPPRRRAQLQGLHRRRPSGRSSKPTPAMSSNTCSHSGRTTPGSIRSTAERWPPALPASRSAKPSGCSTAAGSRATPGRLRATACSTPARLPDPG